MGKKRNCEPASRLIHYEGFAKVSVVKARNKGLRKSLRFSLHSPAQDLVPVDGVVGRDLMGFRRHNAVVKRC